MKKNTKNDLKRRVLQKSIEEKLRVFSKMDEQALFTQLNTEKVGLSSENATTLLELNGKNIIIAGKKKTLLSRILSAVINPFNIILLVIAVVTYFTDVFFSEKADYLTVSIILSLIIISSLVSVIQGERSNTAFEKLSQLVVNEVDVLRDGETKSISMELLVAGDMIKLSAGDIIPADIRFVLTKDTFVAQAALTGESHPIEKFTELKSDSKTITDSTNIGFMGSNMVSGSALAVVLNTGNQTFFGSMAQSLSGDRSKKSFERGVNAVSSLLIRMTLLMVPVVLLINGLLKQDWIEAVLFSVSIAVGLMPEMLPVIMTSTLAKGAVVMSKHEVIVKTLGSIQTFGEMDILCTDKTGTLTEDHIILEKYMDLQGNDDERILRHAFLNSYFQTGLKNLIDVAIIRRAEERDIFNLKDNYLKIDEIPFDFSRRRMSVVIKNKEGKRQLITKGAVEEMLIVSSYVEINGKVEKLTDAYRKVALDTYEKYNKEGLRILAVAQKNEVPEAHAFSVADESDMVIIGFIGFLDPPKESAKEAIYRLKENGIRTIVLTGDSEGVTAKVCRKLDLDTTYIKLGSDIESMSNEALKALLKVCSIYAKLSPVQKERIVALLQELGHTVGYMGDGINDAQALHQADVGISVDSAVDIAKETADIILLKKDLSVLVAGVIEGRKTFGNIIKYIKMAASGNFGNVISVIFASIFLPFLPMLPVHILTQNLLNDFSQMGMPFDHVDTSYLKKPRKWNSKSIWRFTVIMGILSSIFDILTFGVLWFVIGANTKELAPLFQAGWFVFGTISQVIVIYMIRTSKIPLIQSRPSKILMVSTLLIVVIALIIGFTKVGISIDLMVLPPIYLLWLCCLTMLYALSAEGIKRIYIKRYHEWM